MRVYPRSGRRKRRWPAAALLLFLAVAGCGDGKKTSTLRQLDAHGARFSVPQAWRVTRTPTTVAAAPDEESQELVSVSVFRLLHPYRPALWAQVVPELDRAAAELARELSGSIGASRTVTVAAAAARQYDISFTRQGRSLKERITFVLRGRREYELLCRWPAEASEPAACASLVSTFRPASA